MECVLADTGSDADTKDMIEGVAIRRQREPERYGCLVDEASAVISSARQSLQAGDMLEVGRLMDENHRLLQAIETPSREQDELVAIARRLGALGAKETGAGGGGYVVALTPGRDRQQAVASGIEALGYSVLRIAVGT